MTTQHPSYCLTISMGNEEMSEPEHVARLLHSLAQGIEDTGRLGSGKLRDGNGNTVGSYGREAI